MSEPKTLGQNVMYNKESQCKYHSPSTTKQKLFLKKNSLRNVIYNLHMKNSYSTVLNPSLQILISIVYHNKL